MNKERTTTYIENLSKGGKFGVGLLDYFSAKLTLFIMGRSVFSELVNALNHENQYIIFQVVDMLGKIGDRRAIPYLKEMLKRTDLWGATTRSLGIALIRLGDKTGIDLLKNKITDPGIHRELRINSARALANLKIKNVFGKDEQVDCETNIPERWRGVFKKTVEELRATQ